MIVQIKRKKYKRTILDYEFINDDSIVYAGLILNPVQIENLIKHGNTVISESLYTSVSHDDIIKEVKRIIEPKINKTASFELKVIEHPNERENAIEEVEKPTYLLIKVPEWYITIRKDGHSKHWHIKRDGKVWNRFPYKNFKDVNDLITYIESHYKFKVANDVKVDIEEKEGEADE